MEINWGKLQKLLDCPADLPKGKGWFKFPEFQEKIHMGSNRSRRILSNGIKSGDIEIHKGSEWNKIHKQRTRMTWYRFISDK